MRGREMRFFKVLKVLLCVLVAGLVFGVVTEHLWNWLMPGIFGLRVITFWQALGLVVLGKILFGGFHKHGHYGGGRKWRQNMEVRWAGMSDEEREKFRAGMRGRRGCGFGRGGRGEFETAEKGTV
jgi:hypothetical protein